MSTHKAMFRATDYRPPPFGITREGLYEDRIDDVRLAWALSIALALIIKIS